MKLALLSIWLALPLMLVGCTTWERTTFQTLASAQNTLNTAQAAYEVSANAPCPPGGTVACLPHSAAVNTVISKAKAADTLAVNAMVTYEEAKFASAGTTGLAAAEAEVNAAMLNLGTLIGDVQALSKSGGSN